MPALRLFLTSESGNSALSYCAITGAVTAVIAWPLQEIGQQLSRLLLIIARALASAH